MINKLVCQVSAGLRMSLQVLLGARHQPRNTALPACLLLFSEHFQNERPAHVWNHVTKCIMYQILEKSMKVTWGRQP